MSQEPAAEAEKALEVAVPLAGNGHDVVVTVDGVDYVPRGSFMDIVVSCTLAGEGSLSERVGRRAAASQSPVTRTDMAVSIVADYVSEQAAYAAEILGRDAPDRTGPSDVVVDFHCESDEGGRWIMSSPSSGGMLYEVRQEPESGDYVLTSYSPDEAIRYSAGGGGISAT